MPRVDVVRSEVQRLLRAVPFHPFAVSLEDGTRVVKIDPSTLKVTDLISHHDTKLYGVGSVAIQVGNEYWLGSATSDRIAVFPAPK